MTKARVVVRDRDLKMGTVGFGDGGRDHETRNVVAKDDKKQISPQSFQTKCRPANTSMLGLVISNTVRS